MKKVIVFLSCVWLAVNVLLAEEPYKYEYLYKDLPFEMPRVKAPVFPDNEVNLKDFGAVGDGMHLCTEAFAKAIDALDKKGGGKLTVPAGVWFTGPIVLKSNINLHIPQIRN